MTESLLPWYDRELAALRRAAGEFAEGHKLAASALRMTGDRIDDPHVERLLQGVAFLGARVHQRLDDEVPELFESLLDLLSPQLLAPLPSMMMVQLLPRPGAPGRALVSRHTVLETQPVRGEALTYRTCRDVELWPLQLREARLDGLPLPAPANPHADGAVAVLRLSLATTSPDLPLKALQGLDRLTLHLRGGLERVALLELLCTSTLSIAVADGAGDPAPTFLAPQALRHTGFEDAQAALPWPRSAFSGHRLLAESFAFHDKFMQVELSGLGDALRGRDSPAVDLFVYLRRGAPAGSAAAAVDAETFVLGATAAVNLFELAAEPITLDGTQSHWRIVPDAGRPAALEVHSVLQVRHSRAGAPRPVRVPHFQALQRAWQPQQDNLADGMTWTAARQAAAPALGGIETMLTLRDLHFDPAAPADGVLSCDVLCLNRDLPTSLPYGGGEPVLRIVDPTVAAARALCLSPPTPTVRPPLGERGPWRLVSHLTLNHLGITGGEHGAAALRELIRLHDNHPGAEPSLAIAGLRSVDAVPTTARLPGQRPGSFVRGLDITLLFDAQAWASGGLFLVASVLEHFFAMQVSVNSFVRTTVRLTGRESPVVRWPARSGSGMLL